MSKRNRGLREEDIGRLLEEEEDEDDDGLGIPQAGLLSLGKASRFDL